MCPTSKSQGSVCPELLPNSAIVLISDIIIGVIMSDKKAVIKNADMSEEMQQV